MGRRVSSGVVGGSGLGTISVVSSEISTTTVNGDLTFNPNGTGRVVVDSDMQINSQSDLRFGDGDNSNWVAFQAPTTVPANVTWTLPSANGNAGEALVISSGTTLSWGAAGAVISDQNSGGAAGSSSTYYPLLSSSTSGSATAIDVSSTKLTFQPSTGTLTATNLVESSSIELKENVSPIQNALNSLLMLNGVTYDRKDGTRQNEAGLIAEDVIQVIPNIVTVNDSGKPEGIQYTKITAYLIEAVKELNQKIESMKR